MKFTESPLFGSAYEADQAPRYTNKPRKLKFFDSAGVVYILTLATAVIVAAACIIVILS